MTRQHDGPAEDKHEKRMLAVGYTMEGRLRRAVQESGRELTGVAFKFDDYDCLAIIKASGDDGPEVAFVGAETWVGALLKASREAQRGGLKWRSDKWAGSVS